MSKRLLRVAAITLIYFINSSYLVLGIVQYHRSLVITLVARSNTKYSKYLRTLLEENHENF